jgi:hypothetical protein
MRFFIVLISLILFSGITLFSQKPFFKKDIEWNDYSKKDLSFNSKVEKINSIDDGLLFYLKSNSILRQNLSNFHFIDYDLDGEIEILYSGDAGTDAKRTLIFELNKRGNYVKTFDKFGEVYCIRQFLEVEPFSFILKEEACCGGITVTYEIYHPIYEKDSLRLRASSKYCSIKGVKLPKKEIEPIRFKVKNERYYLRLNPMINNKNKVHYHLIKGNVISEYTKGAQGYAIAKETDDSGRIWWFVIMNNQKKPSKTVINNGSNNNNDFYSFGWMSSRYLKAIE